METKGQINIYTCDTCRGEIVTINRNEGVTPAFLSCNTTRSCPGTMASQWYHVPQDLTPDWEWFMPDRKEWRNYSRAMVKHFQMGGLDLRKIG